MKLIAALILGLLPLYALGYTVGYSLGYIGEVEVHYHAGFHIYEDGTQVDLSGLEYMTIQPCGVSHRHDNMKEYEASKVHLHDGVGDVVHVHAEGQTWRMLLDSLGLEAEKYRQTYREGVEVSLMDDLIVPYERVIFADENTEVTQSMIEGVPSIERIEEVENTSETCSE